MRPGVKGQPTIWILERHGQVFVGYGPASGYLEYRLAGSEADTISELRAEVDQLRAVVDALGELRRALAKVP